MSYTVIRGGRLTFAQSIHPKSLEIKDLKVTGLKRRTGKKDNVGDMEFVEGETLHGRRASLISRESNLGSAVVVQKTWWVNICEIW